MVKFSAVKPGDVLYQKKRQKMGNTTMSRDAVFACVIKEVHDTWALVSWNGNAPERWRASQVEKLSRSKPQVRPSMFDRAMQSMKP